MSRVLEKGGDDKAGDRMIGICHNADVTMYMSHTVYVTKYMSQLLRKGGEGQL